MAISLPSGFKVTATEPIDNRMVLTKAEMLALKKPTMPDKYICVCKDDGKLYLYDKNKEVLDPEVGRFTVLEDQIDMNGEKFKENLDKAVADNIEAGSESTKIAINNVVNEAIEQIKIDGQVIE